MSVGDDIVELSGKVLQSVFSLTLEEATSVGKSYGTPEGVFKVVQRHRKDGNIYIIYFI